MLLHIHLYYLTGDDTINIYLIIMASNRSPVTVRPTHRPYNEYCQRECHHEDTKLCDIPEGPRIMVQMVFGFTTAALFGLVMLVFGSVFIGNAIKSKYAITIMLCVMGIGKFE